MAAQLHSKTTMISFKSTQAISTIFLVATLIVSENATAADSVGSVSKARAHQSEFVQKESVAIKGEHISQVFAASCAENSFAQFQSWALKNHFLLRQFESPVYQIADGEIKDDELLFSVKINDQNQWQANLRDQIFTGVDPCEAAMAYLDSRAPKPVTFLSLLIPEARAEKLVNESCTTNWLLGALATAAITDGAFLDNIANRFTISTSLILSAAFRAMNTATLDTSKTNFEKILNQKIELVCSRNRVKIAGQESHIVVKKGYVPQRLGFNSNKSGRALKTENKIALKRNVHEQIISIGQRCSNEQDAKLISAQLQAERELLNRKIAKASLLERNISSDK